MDHGMVCDNRFQQHPDNSEYKPTHPIQLITLSGFTNAIVPVE